MISQLSFRATITASQLPLAPIFRSFGWKKKDPLCWLSVLSLLLARPTATWSFRSAPRSLVHNTHRSLTSFDSIMPRSSARTVASAIAVTAKVEPEGGEPRDDPSPAQRKRKSGKIDADAASPKKSPAKKKKSATKPTTKETSPKKTTRTPKGTTAASKKNGLPEEDEAASPKKKSPNKKAAAHQRITERDVLPRLWDRKKTPKDSYTFRIASWNVAGLRAVLRKNETALADLCREHDLDMLCLQETKLQEMHLDDPKLNIRGRVEGYDEYWNCCTRKNGYSGTAIFVKQRGEATKKKKQTDISSFFGKKTKDMKDSKQAKAASKEDQVVDPALVTPVNVTYKIGKPIDDEGRTITVEFPFATITNVYVPNSGQKLERLDYRTNEWDKDFLAFHQDKEKERGLPVIWLGDLNIAHKAYDIWNDGAKHLAKQAGVTEQERLSFQAQLDAGYVDAFRYLHPEAKGHYSYWSQRAGNREPNQGLRLDYFVCSPGLFSEDSPAVVRDSYMLPDVHGSDHAPVVLEVELKKVL